MFFKQRKYLVNLLQRISVQLDSAFRHIKFWEGRWSDERQTKEVLPLPLRPRTHTAERSYKMSWYNVKLSAELSCCLQIH